METFVCDSCGNEFPINRMKEAFHEEGRKRVTERFCPSCLDKRMNESSKVRGVVGSKKAAAVHLDKNDKTRERASMGKREPRS